MMEKELGKMEIYISDQPILISRIKASDTDVEPSEERKGWPQTHTFILEHNSSDLKKFIKAMKMQSATLSRTGYQIWLLKKHPRHILVMHRCLKYNNRLPRWFRKMYSEIAKDVAQILREEKKYIYNSELDVLDERD